MAIDTELAHVPPHDWSELYVENQKEEEKEKDRGLPRKFTLKLKVLKGTDLPIMDIIGSSDPYVVITLGDQTKKTKVIRENLNPEWNEEFSLAIIDLSKPIRFDVYDWDRWMRDDLIGYAELDLGLYAQAVQMLQHNCILSDGSSARWSGGSVVQDITMDLKNAKTGSISVQLRWENDQPTYD